MADLPIGEHAFYVGIDPGFQGALGLMNAAGTLVKVWDLPVTGKGKAGEFDLPELWALFKRLKAFPDVVAGLEWPTTRPGEGAERSERFGRGKGYLEAFAFCSGLAHHKVSPNLWKGRLGLPGKGDPQAAQMAREAFERFYPRHTGLILGPRGGLKDGRCDALLIAHFLRTRAAGAMQQVIAKHGKESDQAMTLALGGRRKKSRMQI